MNHIDEEFRKLLPGVVKKVIFCGPYDVDQMLMAAARDLDGPTWYEYMTREERRGADTHRDALEYCRDRLRGVSDERRLGYLQAAYRAQLQHYAEFLRVVYSRMAGEE